MILKTKSKEIEVNWVGYSFIANEIVIDVQGNIADLYPIFSNPDEMQNMTRAYDDSETVYTGYTKLHGIEEDNGVCTIRMVQEQ